MKLNRAKGDISELYKLVNSWGAATSPSSEERALALSIIKSLYEAIRFDGDDDTFVEVEEKPAAEVNEYIEPQVEMVAEPEPEVKVTIEEEPVNTACNEQVTHIETVECKTPQPTEDRSEEERRERRRHIISLYGDDGGQPIVETPQPIVENSPIVEPECACEAKAEPVEEVAPVAEQQSNPSPYGLPSIGSLLTLNDRFLLSNDLFDGNMVMLNSALIALDEQQTLDDSLLYIAENYRWSGDSDGAQLLNTLLESRFNN